MTDPKWVPDGTSAIKRTINDYKYTIYWSRPGVVRYNVKYIDEIDRPICCISSGNYSSFDSAKRGVLKHSKKLPQLTKNVNKFYLWIKGVSKTLSVYDDGWYGVDFDLDLGISTITHYFFLDNIEAQNDSK